MIYLCNSEQGNQAVYLDMHSLERQERGFVLSGILGDGHYEGDVMVEVGADVDVTFADLWLNRAELKDFFDRVDRQIVESALIDAARTVVDGKDSRGCPGEPGDPRPHIAGDRRMSPGPIVSSGEATWSPSA